MTKPNLPNVQNISNDDDLGWKMTSNGRLPKIAKFEYLNNHWSDLSQISVSAIAEHIQAG